MKLLFCPWRSPYAATADSNTTKTECVFCNHFTETNDQQNFILRRFEHTVVILNRFPYNAGHLLIIPIDHVAELYDLPKTTRQELMELVFHSTKIIKEELAAHGINVGLNLGKAAGAGLPAHLHMHILPRWIGDTNFLPVLGETKQISFDLTETYKRLKPHFDKIQL